MNMYEAILEAIKNIKSFEVKEDTPDTGTFKTVITSEVVDRDGEIIRLAGWDFENYNKNPVVLWGHRYWDLPVAKATWLTVEGGKVIASGIFAPAEANPMGQQIRKLYEGGFINAVSVGFKVIKRNPDNRYIIEEAELLEFSFVTVPANPEALGQRSGVKSYMEVDISDETKDANTVYYATYLLDTDGKSMDPGKDPETTKGAKQTVEVKLSDEDRQLIEDLKADVNELKKSTANGKADKVIVSKEVLQQVNRLTSDALRDLK